MAIEVIDQFRDASNQQLVNAGDSTNTAIRVNVVSQTGTSTTVVSTATVVQGTASNLNANVSAYGVIDVNNSSTNTLAANGTFIGTSVDLLPYASVAFSVFADQNSTTNGFQIQYSKDNVNWDDTEQKISYIANIPTHAFLDRQSRYYRILFTNTNVGQTIFRLQSILQPTSPLFHAEFTGNSLDDTDSAIITKGVIYGKTTGSGGGYVQVKVTPSGALNVDGTSSQGGSWTTTVTQGTASNLNATVVGTVTSVPSGTQSVTVVGTVPVSGTITNVQSGTATDVVSGTVTIIPSGTQAVSQVTIPWITRGTATVVVNANPSAGADWGIAITAAHGFRIHGVIATFATSTATGTRQPSLSINDGVSVNYYVVRPTTNQIANTTITYQFFEGVQRETESGGTEVLIPLPMDNFWASGVNINSSTPGMLSGDQWSTIRIFLEIW